MENGRSIWKNKDFVKFFSANAMSNLGNWFDFIAVLILFRYSWKAEPMLIALIPIMYAIPSIVLGQFAGVIADRMNKLKILIYSDWIRALLTMLLVFTTSPILALPVLLLRNTVGVITLPAQQGLMRTIVKEKDIMKAVTINGSLFQLVKVIGPLIGGSVVALSSPQYSMVINATSFFISGIILKTMSFNLNTVQNFEQRKERAIKGFFTSWKEGWSIVIKSRVLLASILFGIVCTLMIQMIDAQFVTLFSEVFPKREELTGWAISAIGIGSLIVVLFLNRLDRIKKYGWFFGIGCLLIGVMTAGFGYLSDHRFIMFAIGLGLIGGIGNGITFTAVNYLIQKEPPQEAIGRVSSIVDSTLSILFIAGPLLGGFLINLLGVISTFKYIGFTLTVIGLVAIVFQKHIWKDNLVSDNTEVEQTSKSLKEFV